MDKRTPLYGEHLALGAKTTSFGGWEMPVSYHAGPVAEHRRCARPPVCLTCRTWVRCWCPGSDATAFLQVGRDRQCVQTASRATRAYAPMCYADGGLVDDTFVYRLPDRYLVVVNASNTAKGPELAGVPGLRL